MTRAHLGLFALASFSILGPAAIGQDTVRVSVGSKATEGNRDSGGHFSCSISPDGRYVVFMSYATTFLDGDTNGLPDVFLHDRFTGETRCASVGLGGAPANGASTDSYQASVSADGRRVAFVSSASNLVAGDANGMADVFVRDFATGQTFLASVDSAGAQANRRSLDYTLSQDGRYVVFSSPADNLVAGDTNGVADVFLHDLSTGRTIRVSVDSNGAEADGESYGPSISADGRFIAFTSDATNLVAGDTNGADDVFVHDLSTGRTSRVSLGDSGQEGNGDSEYAAISADGRSVVFLSEATNLVSGDTNGYADAFVRDLAAGRTTIASVNSAGEQAWTGSQAQSAISADGRFVAFASWASNLDPHVPGTNTHEFLHDRSTGQTTVVDANPAGSVGSEVGYSAGLSADGRFVVFESRATILVPGDANGAKDVFVHDQGSAQANRFCTSESSGSACPCANSGWMNRGCENGSDGTGGASIVDFGTASISSDTLLLLAEAELRGAPTFLVQGDAQVPPVPFSHGLRCVGGNVERLDSANASAGGVARFPSGGGSSISARSAALGGPIAAGSTRYYQVIYRDVNRISCPAVRKPWNVSSGLAIRWGS